MIWILSILYFILTVCMFCAFILEFKVNRNRYENLTEKQILQQVGLSVIWPFTLIFCLGKIGIEDFTRWVNKE